jgi:hypothetical protein
MNLPAIRRRPLKTVVSTLSVSAALLGTVLLGVLSCSSDERDTSPTGTTTVAGGSAAGGSGAAAGTGGSGAEGAQAGQGGTTGSGGGAGAGGSTGSGQLIVDPADPAWLAYDTGGSYFLCAPGDPEGFLYRGTRNEDGTRTGDQQALIDKLAPTGANGIYLMAVRSHGGDGAADENPFVDSNPALGLDEELLGQWEGWFSAMDQAGITIYFFVYDDSASIWSTGDVVGAEEQAFLEALVNRFEHHQRLIWVLAEEYAERFSAARASAIAAAVRAADDADHVIAVHQNHGLAFDFSADANIDQFAIQYNVETASELHAGAVSAFESAAGQYNLNLSEAANYGTGPTARRKSWAIAMAGAYVMELGMDIASSAVSDLEDCGRLRSFFEQVELAGMAPHDELAHAGSQHVLALPGSRYVAYAASASATLGVRSLSAGSYSLRWFDPVTGSVVDETATVGAGDATFTKPGGIGDEVALYLR